MGIDKKTKWFIYGLLFFEGMIVIGIPTLLLCGLIIALYHFVFGL